MTAIVDLGLIAGLGEPEFVDEMVGLFVELCALQVEEIRSALVRADARSVVFAAHKLKGASAAMAAATVAELCDGIEREGRAARLDPARDLFGQLEVAVRETTAQLRAPVRATPETAPAPRPTSRESRPPA